MQLSNILQLPNIYNIQNSNNLIHNLKKKDENTRLFLFGV